MAQRVNVLTLSVGNAITTTTWEPWNFNGSGVLSPAGGGTGIANNNASTLTISGNFATTLTVSGTTGVTLPTTGTLATLAGTEELTNKTLNASVGKGTWTASGTWQLPAFTLGGTVSGGANQINNVVIGTSNPLAGTFTALTATGAVTLGDNAADVLLMTTNAMVIDSSGQRTLPLQPLFLAKNNATDSSVTGDGTVFAIICDTEILDRNADYNNTTGVFTAPVTGFYIFGQSVQWINLGILFTSGEIDLIASNRSYGLLNTNYGAMRSGTELVYGSSVMVDMDAGDTAYLQTLVSGSTKTIDVGAATYFFGMLLA